MTAVLPWLWLKHSPANRDNWKKLSLPPSKEACGGGGEKQVLGPTFDWPLRFFLQQWEVLPRSATRDCTFAKIVRREKRYSPDILPGLFLLHWEHNIFIHLLVSINHPARHSARVWSAFCYQQTVRTTHRIPHGPSRTLHSAFEWLSSGCVAHVAEHKMRATSVPTAVLLLNTDPSPSQQHCPAVRETKCT